MCFISKNEVKSQDTRVQPWVNVQYLGNRKLNNEGDGGEDSGKTTHVNDYDVFMNHREQTIPSTVHPERHMNNLCLKRMIKCGVEDRCTYGSNHTKYDSDFQH